MKITTFDPMIITKDPEKTVKLFEELGFELRHQPDGSSASGFDYKVYRMKDANGFHVDVSYSAAAGERDLTAIRINVDNFNEAYDLLIKHGFTSPSGRPATETDCSRGILMMAPSGFGIVLCQHIKQ